MSYIYNTFVAQCSFEPYGFPTFNFESSAGCSNSEQLKFASAWSQVPHYRPLWNCSPASSTTSSVEPAYSYGLNENFRVPSFHRQHRIMAIEARNGKIGEFFVNMTDLTLKAPRLADGLCRVLTAQNGHEYGVGEVGVDVDDFEMMLKLMFHSYQEKYRSHLIGRRMFHILVLAKRFRVPQLIEECKLHVLNADYSRTYQIRVKSWLDGFKVSGCDNDNGKITSFLKSQLAIIKQRDQYLAFGIRVNEIRNQPYISEHYTNITAPQYQVWSQNIF